jgi:RimJ/RimL family protein N-acetyltransferase
VGVVRFELEGEGQAVVSINIAPEARGRGIGQTALLQACERVSDEDGVSSVTAHIKPDNAASLRAFEQADFVRTGSTTIEDTLAVKLEWTSGADR